MHARQGEQDIQQDKDYPELLETCGWNSKRLVELFKDHDKPESYSAMAGKEVPNSWELHNETSILTALAFAGCPKLVKRHLDNCRQCRSPSGFRSLERAVHLALDRGFRTSAEAILNHPVSSGATFDLNTRHRDTSPLYSACVSGDVEIVDLLMQSKADPLRIFTSQPYPSALHAAVAHENPKIVDIILQNCYEDEELIESMWRVIIRLASTQGFGTRSRRIESRWCMR